MPLLIKKGQPPERQVASKGAKAPFILYNIRQCLSITRSSFKAADNGTFLNGDERNFTYLYITLRKIVEKILDMTKAPYKPHGAFGV